MSEVVAGYQVDESAASRVYRRVCSEVEPLRGLFFLKENFFLLLRSYYVHLLCYTVFV